ncbi:MAG: hypothetical protein U0132_08905 [Gemmatimonadaceae bacterium]
MSTAHFGVTAKPTAAGLAVAGCTVTVDEAALARRATTHDVYRMSHHRPPAWLRARRAVCLLPLAAGCYRYAPMKASDVSPGTGIRARINVEAGSRIAPLLGVTSARDLRGTLISATADTLVVEVPAPGVPDPDASGRVLNQRVSIARSEVLELETRTLDRVRTAALVGGSVAVLVSVLVKVLKGEPGADKTPGPGGTDDIVPLLGRVR